jgi:hypothetical protein
MNQGWLELRCGRTIDHKWSQYLGRLVQYHPVTVAVTVIVIVIKKSHYIMLVQLLKDETLDVLAL